MVSNITMEKEVDFIEMEGILEILNHKFGYDFRDYAKASLLRRVNKFASENKISTAYDLEFFLLNTAGAFQLFLQEITVNVTELFRDPTYYAFLRNQVIPVLSSYPIIKIWHAGCSTGEEVFSMCILLHEAGLLNRTKIYATDINPQNIEKAKKGILPLRAMKDFTANYINAGGTHDFADYYTARYSHAIIHDVLRKSIIFSQHNLVVDQPFNEFQFISCRNVMIYFNRFLQDRVLQVFYDSLSSRGYLGIGLKETLAFSKVKGLFDTMDSQLKIYRRKT
jgi:chemotaxis protein methyltransferase CheR